MPDAIDAILDTVTEPMSPLDMTRAFCLCHLLLTLHTDRLDELERKHQALVDTVKELRTALAAHTEMLGILW